jgi:predicted lipoprotein with Yx(FWY)xxD motif
MTRTRSIRFLTRATVPVLAALAVASCGSNTSDSPPQTANGQSTTVGVANENLGSILVDSQGRTLYLFEKDKGTTSACGGACASAWPPLTAAAKPTVADGAKAGKLGSAKQSDGTTIVTYGGHPLYTYVGDSAPGEANGNDIDQFGAEWYALQPNAEEPED